MTVDILPCPECDHLGPHSVIGENTAEDDLYLVQCGDCGAEFEAEIDES